MNDMEVTKEQPRPLRLFPQQRCPSCGAPGASVGTRTQGRGAGVRRFECRRGCVDPDDGGPLRWKGPLVYDRPLDGG